MLLLNTVCLTVALCLALASPSAPSFATEPELRHLVLDNAAGFLLTVECARGKGEFHDQGAAKWIVIRRPLWGHNNTPFGRPTPGRPLPGLSRGLAALRAYWVV
jgi:hypothetical protein